MDNFVALTGNVTRDPELRFTQGGRAVVSFGIAVSRRWQTNGEWQEQTSFFNCTAWAELAENVAQTCPKGTRVTLTGRLEQQSWEQEGEKKTKIEVIVETIGPDLRWASAEVSRNEREQTDTTATGRPRQTRKPKDATQAAPVDYGDEEPF